MFRVDLFSEGIANRLDDTFLEFLMLKIVNLPFIPLNLLYFRR